MRYIFHAAGDVDPRRVRALVEGAAEPEVTEAIVSLAENLREMGRAEGLREGEQKGLQKGLKKGRQEGKAEILLKQLQLKFGRLPAATTARVRAAGEAELERWTERVLTGTSVAGVLDG